MKKLNRVQMTLWFTAGTALGVLTGLLFAPKTGKDVRDHVAKAATKVGETIAKSGQGLFEKSKTLAGGTADALKKGVSV